MSSWLLLLVLFTVICAFIGYVTNVLAVKMIFRPHQRVTALGVSFQGVLPKHQAHFARMLSAIIVRDFMSLEDLVGGLNRPELVDEVERLARRMAADVIDELRATVPEAQRAMLSPQMIDAATEQLIREARSRVPEIIATTQARAASVLDLEQVVTDKVMGLGAGGLERVIYAVSKKELDFIEYYGAIFGFFLGVLQFGVLHLFGDWVLPVVGCIVGTVTNWMAIQMLFYPREPTKYLGFFTYQGMFPKRQKEMAVKMGSIAASELILPEEIFGELTDRMVPSSLEASDVEQAELVLRAQAPRVFQVADALVPESARPELRARVARRMSPRLGEIKGALVAAATTHLDIHGILRDRIAALKKSEFEQLLRGLFEREEIYLIIYGGILGALIGGLQLLIVGWVG